MWEDDKINKISFETRLHQLSEKRGNETQKNRLDPALFQNKKILDHIGISEGSHKINLCV